MTLVAEQFEHVVGVDTHARTHTYCLVHAATGARVDTATFPTSAAGNARAVSWIARRSKGTTVLASVEGTSSYGARITALLTETGMDVAEVRPAARTSLAHAGKSDLLDAEAAARSVLGQDLEHLSRPRQTGDRTALRVLLTARSLIDQQRTAARIIGQQNPAPALPLRRPPTQPRHRRHRPHTHELRPRHTRLRRTTPH